MGVDEVDSDYELVVVAVRVTPARYGRQFDSHSNTVGAAAHLGMNRSTLVCRMKKFGIYAKSTFDLQPGLLS